MDAPLSRTIAKKMFLGDGAMCGFADEQFRLVFVLKEANDPEGRLVGTDEDNREMSEHGYDRGYMWRSLAVWASIILDAAPRQGRRASSEGASPGRIGKGQNFG